MIDVVTFFLGVIFFIFIGFRPPWQAKKLQDFKCKDIPGPFSVPFIGTGWLFLAGRYHTSKIPEFYRDMREKYGRIFKEEALFNIPIISVFERSDIEKVLRSTGKCPIRPPTAAVAKYRTEHPERYASTGLVNEQGEKWQFLRTSLTTVLTSPKTIQDFLPQMDEIVDDWCHLIKQSRNERGYIEHLEDLAGRLGLEAICALVLGRRMGFLIEDQRCEVAEKLANSVHENFKACRDTYFGLPLWKVRETETYKRLCNSEREMYEFASELIKNADDSVRDSAVFQSVLNANVDDREKKSAIVDFLAAGIYTLKNSLLFLLYQVALNPDCQENIIKDQTKAYIKACSMETFRLTPTVHALARVTECDLELSGFHVNAGSIVLCQTSLACKNEVNFKNAKIFKPERWLNEDRNETAAAAAYLVTPFGYGKRICPGKRFIEQVLPVILDKMVQDFVVSVEKPMELAFEFLVSPKAPVCMRFRDRI
ncbi:ecdysone 20-monooxygenase [Euwallacea fornicatus]|uniref:ecdysone 20-monooxygenase n=1 Tax=Euwallacea fornicatus TaxID=995702 RepID=UPI00339005DA